MYPIWLYGISHLLLVCYSLAQEEVPDYVTEYAPLVWLDVNEPYFPGDIGDFLSRVQPALNFTNVTSVQDLDLSSLASLNEPGNCSVQDPGACEIYLTSTDNLTTSPLWLHGVVPNAQGETENAVSSAVITVDHGAGSLDAFYFYWYPFNLGLEIGDQRAGNHLGDWEHVMARFQDGEPQSYWLSIHSAGEAYTYDALEKNGSRPVVYSGLGGHSNFPTPGNHSRDVAVLVLNDTSSAGTLWDPVASAFFYEFEPSEGNDGAFTAIQPTADAPTGWLSFAGHWGDKRYLEDDPRQFSFAGIEYTYDDGPTGPIAKDLNRNDTCPDRVSPCDTTTALPATSGDTSPSQTVSRAFTTTQASAASESTSAAESPTGTGVATSLRLSAGTVLMAAACMLHSIVS